MNKINSLSILDAFNVSFLGMGIVFFVLIVLFIVIKALRYVIIKIESSKTPVASTAVPKVPQAAKTVSSSSSIGVVKLHAVDDATASMLMAIVAEKTRIPINELRFLSIREVSSGVNEGIQPNKKYNFKFGEESSDDMKYKITLNKKVYGVEVERGEAILTNVSDSVTAAAPVAPSAAAAQIAAPPAVGSGKAVNAPMPGTVLSVSVNVGDTVTAGQVLLVLEAMKMENEIVAPSNGKIAQVHITKGSSVNTGEPMITLA